MATENSSAGSGIIYDNSYALIVGIDKYQDTSIRPLDYAVADAEAIAQDSMLKNK